MNSNLDADFYFFFAEILVVGTILNNLNQSKPIILLRILGKCLVEIMLSWQQLRFYAIKNYLKLFDVNIKSPKVLGSLH